MGTMGRIDRLAWPSYAIRDDCGVSEHVSATATFLFTDIEGSTALLKQLRERYAEVLADHHRILREAFAANGGTEIDNQGDSFFVAFRRAREAVLAAADAQRALQEHEWPEGVSLRVRMSIHTARRSWQASGTSACPFTGRHASARSGTVVRCSCRKRPSTCSRTKRIHCPGSDCATSGSSG